MSEHYPGGHRMQDCPTQADSVILRIRTPQDRYRYLIRDQDSIFAKSLDKSISTLGIRILKSPPQSPTANAICERVIGTIRRECLDWMIPLSESHLRLILKSWVSHYNRGRAHMALGPGVPDPPTPPPLVEHQKSRHRLGEGLVVHAESVLGGLHHEYSLVAISA
jgi:putative transposase